jgi:hypothetical protein
MHPPSDRLQSQWDVVPPERQAYYRRMYQLEVRKAGAATDDAAELMVLRRLIKAYQEQSLVPVDSRWVSVPERVRVAARQQQPLPQEAADTEVRPSRRSQTVVGLLLLTVAGGLLFMVVNLVNNGNADEILNATVTISPTATAEITLTPTALALAESDPVIQAGDRPRDFYPVLLHVYPTGDSAGRVFVIQARPVETADWRFDPNPDVASWVSGLPIRIVLGLPFSDDNLRLMQSLSESSRLTLQMNTGASLDFRYSGMLHPPRQDTSHFTQSQPGLALVLIGETDMEGLPTARRWWVLADYLPEQEMARLEESEGAFALAVWATLMGSSDVQFQVTAASAYLTPDIPLDRVFVRLEGRMTTQSASFAVRTWDWLLEDPAGLPVRLDPQVAMQTWPDLLPANTSIPVTLDFLVTRQTGDFRLLAVAPSGEITTWIIPLVMPQPATVAGLEPQIMRVSFADSILTVEARITNPQSMSVVLSESVTSVRLGSSASRLGPALPPLNSDLPARIAAQSAVDMTLTFPYADEPVGVLTWLEREYVLQLQERG